MAVVLGLAAALVYGAADFAGGIASKRTPAFAVVVWSQLAGLVVLAVALPLIGTPVPSSRDLALGAVAGVAGGTGVAFLYRGLAIGRMAVVAPITAVGAACLPVAVGLATGERPGLLALGGVVIALVAVVAVSAAPDGTRASGRPGLAEGVVAGLAFGCFFIVLSAIDEAAGMWPLLPARTSILVIGAAAALTRTPLRVAREHAPMVALAGVLDMGANVLYLLAAQTGLLSLVAVLVSLYPASTVLLARLVLGERLARLQVAGVALAITGAGLIAVG
jgi:drug/metabolite transporter (DMT)-like permease